MHRSATVLTAVLLLLFSPPILGEGQAGKPVSVDRQLARWAAELGTAAMQSASHQDERYLSAALKDAGPAAYATLEKLLFSDYFAAKRVALAALQGREDRELVPLLRRAFFESQDASVRGQVLEHLRRFGEADGLEADLILKTAGGPDERRIAVENLALLGPEALPTLMPLLVDGEEDLTATFDTIANWGDEGALSVLLEIQKSEDPRLHAHALGMLGTYASAVFRAVQRGENVSELLDLAYHGSTAEGRKELLEWYAAPLEWHDKDHAFVLDAAGSPDPRMRQLAAAALERSSHANVESALRSLAEDPSGDVRWQAAITLARIGVADAVPMVLDAMAASYRLHPPPPFGTIRCATGVDLFRPAKSALVRLSGRLLEPSAEGDVAVWREWWQEVGDSFDPLEVHLDLLQSYAEGIGSNPSLPILARLGDVETAARLLDLRNGSYPVALLDQTLVAIGRRYEGVVALLASELADTSRPVGERWLRLQMLRRIEPGAADDYFVTASDKEVRDLIGSDPNLGIWLAAAERLIAMLPESAHGRGAGPYARTVYQMLHDLEDDRYCADLESASAAETSPGFQMEATRLLAHLGCDGARALTVAALAAPENRKAATYLARDLAGFRNPEDLPAIMGALRPHAPEYEVRSVAMSVAVVLGVRTGPGILRELASSDPQRRQGALFLVRTIIDREWEHAVSSEEDFHLTLAEISRPEITARLR